MNLFPTAFDRMQNEPREDDMIKYVSMLHWTSTILTRINTGDTSHSQFIFTCLDISPYQNQNTFRDGRMMRPSAHCPVYDAYISDVPWTTSTCSAIPLYVSGAKNDEGGRFVGTIQRVQLQAWDASKVGGSDGPGSLKPQRSARRRVLEAQDMVCSCF